jgi:hypothetical protein
MRILGAVVFAPASLRRETSEETMGNRVIWVGRILNFEIGNKIRSGTGFSCHVLQVAFSCVNPSMLSDLSPSS